MESTKRSTGGVWHESFGHVSLMSLKSVEIQSLFEYFVEIMTELLSHSRYVTSYITSTSFSLATSSLMNALLWDGLFCFFCFTGLTFRSTFREKGDGWSSDRLHHSANKRISLYSSKASLQADFWCPRENFEQIWSCDSLWAALLPPQFLLRPYPLGSRST